MDFLIGATTGLLRKMSLVLGGWSFPRNIANDLDLIVPYLQKANMFIPIATAMTVFALWCSLQLVLLAYYWLTRAINLLRGAG